jgi:ceramide glucosyltransferase
MIFADIAALVLVILISAGSAYAVFSIFSIAEFFGKSRSYAGVKDMPPVSVLKPLKGFDPELFDNIRSFCEQDYPESEMLLGLNRPDEEELFSAEDIAANLSKYRIRAVSSDYELGANQKVSNLQGLFDAASNPLIVLSDSDMRVGPDYLKTIVSEYLEKENTGLVTCLYKISAPQSTGAAFESMSIALDFLPSVLVARRIEGVSFGLGASMLLSAGLLQETGGFRAIADYLADDYQLGYRVWKRGYKIVISRYVVEDVAGKMSFAEYFRHQLRWAKTIRISRPAGFLGSGITHIFPLAILLCLVRGFDVLSLFALGIVLLLRLATAAAVYNKVIKTAAWLKWLFIIPLKDIMSFIIWLGAFVGTKVSWRGEIYEIFPGGKMRKCST